jgi:hypothetical protein
MSPEIWDDARARITAACSALVPPLPVQWPNEDKIDTTGGGNGNNGSLGQPIMWLDIEAAGAGSDIIEITGRIWKEDGTIFLHLMIPLNTGIRDGLIIRKTLSEAFRFVTDQPPGLFYRSQDFDPLGPDTGDGSFMRLSLLVRYDYQDTTGYGSPTGYGLIADQTTA